MIPLSRISELHWLLRSIPDNDLLLMRRQGRILYDKYFATGQSVIDTILGVVRNRLLIPPRPIPDESATSVFPNNFKVRFGEVNVMRDSQRDIVYLEREYFKFSAEF